MDEHAIGGVAKRPTVCVEADLVALDEVAIVGDINTGAVVAGNQIARACRGTADGSVCPVGFHAGQAIAKGLGSCYVSADVIAAGDVRGIVEFDAVAGVAGNQVSFARGRAADGIIGACRIVYAIADVGNGLGASKVGADVVADDHVAVGCASGAAADGNRQINAGAVVTGDHVAGLGRRAADRVVDALGEAPVLAR